MIDFYITWNERDGEYVAKSPQVPDVSGHSREPGLALRALIRKLDELGHYFTSRRSIGCPECFGTAMHKMDCSRRGEPLP